MPCNNCSQNNCSGCDVEVHICNQCPSEQPCECEVKDLSTDCILYNQDPIECNDVVVVPTNTILSDALNNIVSWTCTKFSEVQNFFTLKNVGTGAGVYKGINLLGEKELKSITKTGSLVTITPSTNEIALSVDEDALETFVNNLVTVDTYTSANVGDGEGIYKEKIGTEFKFKTVESTQDSLTIGQNGADKVDFNINEVWIEAFLEGFLPNYLTQWLTENSQIICSIVADCPTDPGFVGDFGYSDVDLAGACAAPPTTVIYRDVPLGQFGSATQLSTDAALTIDAPAGYYSEIDYGFNAVISRYWNGTAFSGLPEVCA